jgi:hypothetical protein
MMIEAVFEYGGESAVIDFIASVGCARGRIVEIKEKQARQRVAQKALS